MEQFANDSSHFLDMDTEAHLTERLYTGFIGFGNSGTFDLMEVMYFLNFLMVCYRLLHFFGTAYTKTTVGGPGGHELGGRYIVSDP